MDLPGTYSLSANSEKDVPIRALEAIFLISLVPWLLSCTADGDVEDSAIYKIGTFIEPVTHIFGLSWQTFLTFIFAATFNIPYIVAAAPAYQETHSAKWIGPRPITSAWRWRCPS